MSLNYGPESYHNRRQKEIGLLIEQGENEVPVAVLKDTILMLGAVIYWAEGSKKGGVLITNSDPALILFMVNWLRDVFGIQPQELRAWLNIYKQQDEGKLVSFWSDITNIPRKNFGKSFIKPPNKSYKSNNLYFR
jgi:hypothetical protein